MRRLDLVVGPNGSGKTTLFNVISGLYRPTRDPVAREPGTRSGRIVRREVRYGDTDLTALAPHRLAALGIGRSFQNIALSPGSTVRDNVMTGRHLRELATAVGAVSVDPRKADRVEAALGPYFTRAGSEEYETTLRLGHAEAVTAVAMGPAAWHVEPERLAARVAALEEPVEVTVSVTLTLYGR